MNKNMPLVSIVMPVYNASKYLPQALNSIISQSYTNWELICVDDASLDNSLSILKKFAKLDKRIKVYANNVNGGVSKTANFALSKAKGDFIARMDADDISTFDRLEKQVDFLNKNKDVVLVGGQCKLINSKGKLIGYKNFPINSKKAYKMLFTSIPVQQPSTMVNKNLLPKKFVWYDKDFNSAEEVDLLFRLFKYGKISNLNDVILSYRIHNTNTSLVNPKKTFYLTLKSRIKAVKKYGYKPSLLSILVNLAQIVVVTILPEKYIYPLFSFVKGFKKGIDNKLQLSPNFALK